MASNKTLAGVRFVEDLDLHADGTEGALKGKRVFVRVDFNVPVDKKTGAITDDARIREALPTIRYLVDRGAKVVLASHMGRPKPGKREPSLEGVGDRLSELLGADVLLPDDCIGDGAVKAVQDLMGKQVVLLENLRFHEGEEGDDEAFARELAKLADVYVNDAFGAAHRAHASVHGLARMFRERAAGYLMRKELDALGRLLDAPDKPYVAVLGGAKVSDKIDVVESLLGTVTSLCIGGAMANTFLAAQGLQLQKSRVEEDKLSLARTILDKASNRGVKVLLPVDVVIATSLESTSGSVSPADSIPEGHMALDIGPKTIELFSAEIERAKTVFWNGPMGLFETPAFARGTFDVAKRMSRATGFTVVGGGDSAAAVKAAGDEVAKGFSHISTGGGASLELIEGKKLPGVEALRSAAS
jgi:phosphoglycerate kinase